MSYDKSGNVILQEVYTSSIRASGEPTQQLREKTKYFYDALNRTRVEIKRDLKNNTILKNRMYYDKN